MQAWTDDFDVTGEGSAVAWKKTDWVALRKRNDNGLPYETRIKVLSSKKGLYVLMDATDKKITAKFTEDFSDLWLEDVFEAFLWPDERDPIYFEYEISPLGRELPIVVPNQDGKFMGWRPWHYEGDRKIRKSTACAVGGKLQSWRRRDGLEGGSLHPLRA